MKVFTIIVFLIPGFLNCFAQKTKTFLIAENVVLPKDSILKTELLQSLDGFLSQKEGPNNENKYVLNSGLLETSDLLDELKGMEKNEKLKNDHFYKCYLSSLNRLADTSYLVQVSYLGIHDSTAVARAIFTFEAKRIADKFYFNAPLRRNTANWKSQVFGKTTVYYKQTLNTKKAEECFRLTEEFDKKLSANTPVTKYYCFDNFHEAMKHLGVDYKSDHSGNSYSSSSSFERDTMLVLNGVQSAAFNYFDPHDLWHSRLRRAVNPALINKPVDEGAAYLYGGSWGLSWQEILNRFKKYAADTPDANWVLLYNETKNFDEKAKFPLNVDMVINALMIQKIEKEKGMPAVMELITCGKKVKDNDNYFKTLEKITGITKADFNTKVWDLIRMH